MAKNSSGGLSGIGSDFFNNIQLAFRLYTDPRVSLITKAVVPVMALGYFILPVDFLPDLIPVLGQLDDVAVMLLLMRLFINLAPASIVSEHRAALTGRQASGPDSTASDPGSRGTARTGTKPDQSAGDVVDAEYRVMKDA